MNKIKEIFYKTFGKLDNPEKLDMLLIGVMIIAAAAFASLIYIIATHNG